MNNIEFVKRVQEIAATNPTYRTGGDGSDGTCDCIGLIIGALGKKYDLHSSNYFARSQMHTLDPLLDESQLHPGAVVYKSRRDISQLHERYQAGGRYYNGNLLDYYHVGVVTAFDPIEITHCTSTNSINGIARDDSVGAWSHFGDLLDVELADAIDPVGTTAVVVAQSGETVLMRKRPDKRAETVASVPIGAEVIVVERAAEWSQIAWNGKRGYMMTEFLRLAENGDTVTITISKSAALELKEALAALL